jgi:hypothetical protein
LKLGEALPDTKNFHGRPHSIARNSS